MVRGSPAWRALLAQLYGWRKRTDNELARLLLQHRYRPPDAPEVVRRVDELIATRQEIREEIASLKGQAEVIKIRG